MITKVEPTAGAMRAANSINMCNGDVHYEDDIKEWAEIIDRETAAPEMLEVLETVDRDLVAGMGQQEVWDLIQVIRAAIRKARGDV